MKTFVAGLFLALSVFASTGWAGGGEGQETHGAPGFVDPDLLRSTPKEGQESHGTRYNDFCVELINTLGVEAVVRSTYSEMCAKEIVAALNGQLPR